MGESCGYHTCEPGSKCCMKCDVNGRLIASGKCVDIYDVDSRCSEYCDNSRITGNDNVGITPQDQIALETPGINATNDIQMKIYHFIIHIYLFHNASFFN